MRVILPKKLSTKGMYTMYFLSSESKIEEEKNSSVKLEGSLKRLSGWMGMVSNYRKVPNNNKPIYLTPPSKQKHKHKQFHKIIVRNRH